MSELITVGEASSLTDANYARTRAKIDSRILVHISRMIRKAAENGERWITYPVLSSAPRFTRTVVEEAFREKGFAVGGSAESNSVFIRWADEPCQ